MNSGFPIFELFPSLDASDAGHVTLIRDSTDANDAVPFQFHLAKNLNSVIKHKILFLSTRTRTSFVQGDRAHIYPSTSDIISTSTAGMMTLDLFTIQQPDFSLSKHEMYVRLTDKVFELIKAKAITLVIIECLQSLKVIFGVDPKAFVRSILSHGTNIRILAASPVGCNVDKDVQNLAEIADLVLDLFDLKTGVATDIDGVLSVTKDRGRWKSEIVRRRYFMTPNALKVQA